ncbi:FecR family protein [Pedobacter antarcticus]|uniref:FecR family protein n=1 Tax=Pedobacter antarcticus TaxID=34086 RepID=UPI00292E8802|nr:FecR domain-containing protein [Pedobacter antarcticus]
MENQRIKDIFSRYLQNQCSVEEAEELLNNFHSDNQDHLRQLITVELNRTETSGDDKKLESASVEVLANIKKQIYRQHQTVPISWWRNNKWLRAGTAAALFLALGTWIYLSLPSAQSDRNTFRHQTTVDLKPGQNKAILTLSDGRRLSLDDQKNDRLDQLKDDAEISKNISGQLIYKHSPASEHGFTAFHTLETPKGGQYQIQLADGTLVWLNSDSKLSYPATFKSSETRTVELTGEAYFEVAHNPVQPFIVKTPGQTVEVLGTHFNMMAYENDDYQETTLLEGAVKVGFSTKSKIIHPGQQAQTRRNSSEINIQSHVDTGRIISWKEGVFTFDNSDIEDVMKQLSRWYDAVVVYQGEKPAVTFTGVIPRNNNLSKVLEVLELAGGVKFKIEGNQIIVKR